MDEKDKLKAVERDLQSQLRRDVLATLGTATAPGTPPAGAAQAPGSPGVPATNGLKAWSDYIEFLHGQVRELCTQFGEIACIWFDGDWPQQSLDSSNAYFAGSLFEHGV